MDKNFCRQIDQESLVEQYVAGKLRGELLRQFEKHLKDCEDHAQALLLEKALKRGVTEFARGEIKSKLRNRLKKREDTRYMMLRYAAILLVAVITPLLIYYQLNVAPDEMADSLAKREKTVLSDKKIEHQDEEQSKNEKSQKTELKARSSNAQTTGEKSVQPAAPGGSSDKRFKESAKMPEKAKRLEIANKQQLKSQDLNDMLKAAKTSPTPKIEAEYPLNEESLALESEAPGMSTQGQREESPSIDLSRETYKKIQSDSISIRGCIDDFLADSELQSFEIVIRIQVIEEGRIGNIHLVKTTHQSPDLESCLFNIIKSWTLPADMGAGTVVQEITY